MRKPVDGDDCIEERRGRLVIPTANHWSEVQDWMTEII